MKDYMMALHQRFCKEPECREVRKELEVVHQGLYQVLDRRGQERLLQPADLKAYLDAAERRNALAIFYLELVSGIRKGKLVSLRWEDLDILNKTISVSKQATKDEDNKLIVARPKTENSIRQISIP